MGAVGDACTSMTIRLYTDFKKLPLENVTVRLSHGKGFLCGRCAMFSDSAFRTFGSSPSTQAVAAVQ